jgi:hypothetical protein
MLIEIYDEQPEKLKKKVAQFYHMKAEKGSRLMIPAKGDCIFLKFNFERDKKNALPVLLDKIAKTYWDDRVRFQYEGLPEELIADRRKALKKGGAYKTLQK